MSKNTNIVCFTNDSLIKTVNTLKNASIIGLLFSSGCLFLSSILLNNDKNFIGYEYTEESDKILYITNLKEALKKLSECNKEEK